MTKQLRSPLIAIAASAALLVGCAKPVPPERTSYVGEWQSQEMALLITQDGSVVYKRIKAGVTTSINGPLQEFEGDNFLVGIGPFKTVFVVSTPPHEVQGKWKMVVDGVELTRAQGPTT